MNPDTIADAPPAIPGHRTGRSVLWRWVLLGHLLLAFAAAAEESPTQLEYRVKAAYLFNFCKFINWPDNALPTPDSPLVIGVLAGGDALNVITAAMTGKAVDQHPVQVRSVTADGELPACHLLFVPRTAGRTAEEVRQAVGSAPVLLVGETDGFAERGGMLGFVHQENRIHFQLHLDRTSGAGFKVSSKLSNVARLVTATAKFKP